MGYNTVALFLNDYAADLQKDPEKTVEVIYNGMLGGDRERHNNLGIQIMRPEHADTASIYISGANNIRWIASVHWTEKDSISHILRSIAQQHGYRIAIRSKPSG